MFDMLKTIILVHVFSYITDVVVIAVISYALTKDVTLSIAISIISYLIIWIKNGLLNKYFLS